MVPSPNPSDAGDFLSAVSAATPSAIWAVGEYESAGQTKTLIVHGTGTTWKRVASPSPGGSDDVLTGVWALSAKDVWAVGHYDNGSPAESSLILHSNGGSGGNPVGIAASAPANAWAVGQFGAASADNALAVRYCAASASRAG